MALIIAQVLLDLQNVYFMYTSVLHIGISNIEMSNKVSSKRYVTSKEDEKDICLNIVYLNNHKDTERFLLESPTTKLNKKVLQYKMLRK